MADWKPAVKEDGFRNSTRVKIDGKPFALFRLEDGIYALDDICSHEYSRLSEGEIWDGEVYCPKHGSRFDIRNGQVRSFPAMVPVNSYPVRVEDGTVYIDMEAAK